MLGEKYVKYFEKLNEHYFKEYNATKFLESLKSDDEIEKESFHLVFAIGTIYSNNSYDQFRQKFHGIIQFPETFLKVLFEVIKKEDQYHHSNLPELIDIKWNIEDVIGNSTKWNLHTTRILIQFLICDENGKINTLNVNMSEEEFGYLFRELTKMKNCINKKLEL
ncbi:hypothetical protein SNEBB_002518 [Seison nebaliae]|nr:hypothetical protein SNEBB_002518 [Seison nebaliae]